MKLTEYYLSEFVALKYAEYPLEKCKVIEERIRKKMKSGECNPENVRVFPGEGQVLLGAIELSLEGKNFYSLSSAIVAPAAEDQDIIIKSLIREAMQHAQSLNAFGVGTRPHTKIMTPGYQRALLSEGFVCKGMRVEFKAAVNLLPDENGSPLQWVSLKETGWDLAVETFEKCTRKSPDGLAAEEDPREVMEKYLSDTELNCDEDCVHIGFLDERPVAFVCAQVSPKSGWSRITYMGLVEEIRQQKLGHWVHKHGFQMIRDQKGTLYHGGTNMDNKAMIELFKKHGCEGFAQMSEWEWHAHRE